MRDELNKFHAHFFICKSRVFELILLFVNLNKVDACNNQNITDLIIYSGRCSATLFGHYACDIFPMVSKLGESRVNNTYKFNAKY